MSNYQIFPAKYELNQLENKFSGDQNTGAYIQGMKQIIYLADDMIRLMDTSIDYLNNEIKQMQERLEKLEAEAKSWKTQW